VPEENDSIAQQRVGEVHGTDIHEEMRRSYLDYAMSVIIGRALPDVRDGLKPVHRRVLYAMDEMGLHHNRPHRKAARVVGDVLGKYHPHGDSAVYDTIVRLVQDFSMRYPLIDGQGNFGSVDGDAPAAMRYTEVRLARLAQVILQDINKETVDFIPNYDESTQEPVVLPALMPNLLVNGSSGIAVGMATNIPPHNLSEVVDAVVAQLENPEITIEDLMESVPGPDFPTAGYIHGRQGISDAYRTGRGLIQVRAKAFVEKGRAGRENIVVIELPYQVNKAKLVERIAELVRGKKIEGVADLRDESDREGMRIVLELKKDEPAMPILNSLYKHTAMQSTFGVIMLALVDNQPRILDLKQVIGYFIDHRKVVVVRRTRYELRQAEARAHILEGYRIALDHLDAVIQLIRRSRAVDEARSGLMGEFGMTETQAQAVLDLTLRRLTQLERQKIQDEYQETIQLIAKLQAILGSEALVRQIIKEELVELKGEYGDPRRTQILEETADISYEDTLADEEMVVTISHGGYIKRSPLTIYRAQRRGGKGTTGMATKEEDYVEYLFVATTHSYILLFTNLGRVHWLKVHEVPQLGRAAKGKALVNFLQVQSGEVVTAMIPIRQFEIGRHLFMATRRGVVKKTELHAYSNPRAGGNETGHGHPLQRGDGAGDRPRRPGRDRDRSGGRGRSCCGGDRPDQHHRPHGERARIRQAHGTGGVPSPGARGQRHYQRAREREERPGGGRAAGPGAGPGDDDLTGGQGQPRQRKGNQRHRASHAGGAPARPGDHRSGRRRHQPGDGRRGWRSEYQRRRRGAGRTRSVGKGIKAHAGS
jgi:DNA gyrase subunit A